MLGHQKISTEMELYFMPLLIWLKDMTTYHVSDQSPWLHWGGGGGSNDVSSRVSKSAKRSSRLVKRGLCLFWFGLIFFCV